MCVKCLWLVFSVCPQCNTETNLSVSLTQLLDVLSCNHLCLQSLQTECCLILDFVHVGPNSRSWRTFFVLESMKESIRCDYNPSPGAVAGLVV